MIHDRTKGTDDVSGAARAAEGGPGEPADELDPTPEPEPEPEVLEDAPRAVDELAKACVRFVATRYGTMLDFSPETLSLLDQWLRDARLELPVRPEAAEVVQSAAGAYLGEVIRRQFGARWFAEGEVTGWRLYLSTVYCAFNPIGMAREALLLEPADGWQAHLELDPGERDAVEARLEALPQTTEEEYYMPTTRFDVLWIVVDALRAGLRSRGLDDVRFGPEDYAR
ncbi:MAG TPA: hypothetical protein VN894_16815 [Polyangiaceae bacterium]|nr:hypothetical protein [Polyangiaceae bacterium]